MNEEIIRKLPFSMIAEQSLLGSILIDPESFNQIADIINASDFYITEHTQIYYAMQSLFLANNEIDLVTLTDMLVQKGVYDKSGGQEYIRTLGEVVPNSLNVKDYARIVKEKSVLRRLIEVCGEISETAYSEQDQVSHIYSSKKTRSISVARSFCSTAP